MSEHSDRPPLFKRLLQILRGEDASSAAMRESLEEVIEEFNRHNERQIVLADPVLGDMQLSGVYTSTDPELFLRFMRSQPHVHVEETPNRIVISSSM